MIYIKFIQACEQYLKTCKVTNADQTYKKVKGYLKRSCELIGNYECEKIDKNMILKYLPDYKERVFYVCGPMGMVNSIVNTLKNDLNVEENNIILEKFIGY